MPFIRNTPLCKGLLMVVCCMCSWSQAAADSFEELRRQMVAEIAADTQETSAAIDKEALDPRVMQVMGRIPRHEFVPDTQKPYAYENRPLPIGHGQTISQPYIVALMTDLLKPEPQHRVLEIGTGSGYQAAILAELTEQVYTLEIIEELARQASQRLDQLGYKNVICRVADGYYGWESAAPFDAIVVTAAASHIPAPLLKQLKPGGRMVIPIGGRFQVQQLMLIEKTADDKFTNRQLLPVRFVPLTGEH
jgi:protein-L-isoaspartate(D-aspartate) O-methyltransferase